MSSLDTIKQELVKQKKLLKDKGFTVTHQNTNPSPSDITNAISNINIDFTLADASESDVIAGKTFYAQNGDLKTGILDASEFERLRTYVNGFICGNCNLEICIPTDEDYTTLRSYAYNNFNGTSIFYKKDLVIPSNITTIGMYCFYKSALSGVLTIPETCTLAQHYSFQNTQIEELVAYGGLSSLTTYTFANSSKLKKITILPPITSIGAYTFAYCYALEEVYLPSTLTSIDLSTFYNVTSLKFMKFTNTTAFAVNSTLFKQCRSCVIAVPYESYADFQSYSGYSTYGNPMVGYGEFSQNDTLISTLNNYTITWHTTYTDAVNATNPITIAPEDGTFYASFTEIATEETETTE